MLTLRPTYLDDGTQSTPWDRAGYVQRAIWLVRASVLFVAYSPPQADDLAAGRELVARWQFNTGQCYLASQLARKAAERGRADA